MEVDVIRICLLQNGKIKNSFEKRNLIILITKRHERRDSSYLYVNATVSFEKHLQLQLNLNIDYLYLKAQFRPLF